MHTKLLTILGTLSVLFSTGAFAQQGMPATHPQAEKAMAKIVLKKDFSNNLKFHSRKVVTMLKNDGAPGLNGLLFMKWKGGPGNSVTASVQWFEKKDDLLNFYTLATKRKDHQLGGFDGTTLWKISENGYSWTDGEHFLVSLAGSPPPPERMVKDWLAMIGSKVAEIEKEAEKNPAPAENAKEAKPLIIYRMGEVPIEMREGDAFGIMLVNDGSEEDPVPRYIIAVAKTRIVIDTKNFELFKAMIKPLPKGTIMFEYGSCSVPRSWGLKEEHVKAYYTMFKELGLVISEKPRTTCYCKSHKK